MYLSFYDLKYKPFQISADAKFLWLGEKHEEALATLKYGVLDNKGFLLLTGDIGTGKTTLINALLNTLDRNILVATIRDPALNPMEFYNYTAHVFGLQSNFTSKASFLIHFERFLRAADKAKKTVLLIIDEAQRIDQLLLEEVRLLSNIEKEDSKLLNIFFVGQSEFNNILLRPENRPIRQRITVNYNIPTLTEQETAEYILHRLKIAGSRTKIFEESALTEIFSFSKGYPRLINIICDRSLLTGFVEGSKTVNFKHVHECAQELEIHESKQATSRVVAGISGNAPSMSPRKEVPANHTFSKQDTTDTSNTFRKVMVAVCSLILLIFCFFSIAENDLHTLQEPKFLNNVKKFWQHNARTLDTKGPDIEIPGMPAQHGPAPGIGNGNAEQDKTLKNSKLPANSTDTPAINRTKEMNIAADKNTAVPGYTRTYGAIQQQGKDNTEQQTVAEQNDFDKSKQLNHSTNANKSPHEDKTDNERNMNESQQIQLNSLVTFEKRIIPFHFNSNFPSVDSLNGLNELVESLLRQPFYRVIVTGFTDSTGKEAYNKRLAEFRANNIKSYLIGRGLAASQVITQGLGSQFPIASNDTFSGRMANRRVEIEIKTHTETPAGKSNPQ